jgi:uncharacterized Rmd1/YagE family protein
MHGPEEASDRRDTDAAARIPVRAFGVGGTLAPRAVEPLFPAEASRVRLTKKIAILRYGAPEGHGWAVVHDFGAIVFIGVDAAECLRVMTEVSHALAGEARPPLGDTFAVEISPGARPMVRFDRVVVGALDFHEAEIIALVVAQSVAMEYHEGALGALVSALEARSRTLAEGGSLSGSTREMLRFIGRGMVLRTQVVHTLSLLESPTATWEDEALDRMYRGLRANFEIEERYRALDHELRITQDNLALMVDLVRQRRSFLLEAAVVALIVLELAVLLFQVVTS